VKAIFLDEFTNSFFKRLIQGFFLSLILTTLSTFLKFGYNTDLYAGFPYQTHYYSFNDHQWVFCHESFAFCVMWWLTRFVCIFLCFRVLRKAYPTLMSYRKRNSNQGYLPIELKEQAINTEINLKLKICLVVIASTACLIGTLIYVAKNSMYFVPWFYPYIKLLGVLQFAVQVLVLNVMFGFVCLKVFKMSSKTVERYLVFIVSFCCLIFLRYMVWSNGFLSEGLLPLLGTYYKTHLFISKYGLN
jgi:hypothetical protein